MREALERALRADPRLVVGLDDNALARLVAYGVAVLTATQRFNLTAARTAEAFADHILDSLTLLPHVRGALVDVGSGSGLPGFPLAIAANVPVTVVESNRKKAEFLSGLLGALGVEGEVVADRAEVAAHRVDLREHALTGTARAVGAAPTVAELTVPFVAVGGVVLLQRGVMTPEERLAVRDAAAMLGAEVVEEVVLDGRRQVLVIEKRSPTPARFPRRTGIPEKRPLCFT